MRAIKALPAEQRYNIQNPSWSLNDPPDWVFEAWGSGRADTGELIGPKNALSYSAFWRGCNLISTHVAQLPLFVMQREDDGGKRRATEHPAYKILRRRASSQLKSYDFKRTIQSNALLCGNGYGYIKRDGNASPMEALWLDPYATYPVRANGILWYVTTVTLTDGAVRQSKLRADDVLHIRGMGFDGLVGYSVVEYARESIALGTGARKYASRFLRNDATPSVVLEHPAKLTPQAVDNLRKSWQNMHAGLDNVGSTAVLQENMKAHTLGMSAKDSQLIELRQFEIREIANFLGIQPHKLGDTTRQGYASLEAENMSYLLDCLDGWLVQWEEECFEKLLTEDEKRNETHLIEFERAALLRADLKTQVETIVSELNNGLVSLNEARAIRNRSSLGSFGDRTRMQQGFTTFQVGESDADDIAFKREVVKQFIADPTIGDVIFNMLDGKKLLDDVSVSTVDPSAEPWLPIIADNGELVTGEVLEDSEGDIVGGETEEPAEPIVAPGANLADDETVSESFGRMVEYIKAKRSANLAAMRDLVSEAASRMARRVGNAARKESEKKNGNFVEWLNDGMAKDHGEIVLSAFMPVVRMIRGVSPSKVQEECQSLSESFLDGFRANLLTASGTSKDKLAERVERFCGILEVVMPQAMAKRILGD